MSGRKRATSTAFTAVSPAQVHIANRNPEASPPSISPPPPKEPASQPVL